MAIFGSALRPDFSADSDMDVLVEFHPDRIPTLSALQGWNRSYRTCLMGGKWICAL
ncbi:nucleotidyltransferase domain-containing protein [Chthonomonas calidirosea]|uniref:nucleotidyltransferase domain-containing protein n=1 Tax=Chthonomonas calidirosea TaxID=454171 RepID=UPI0031B5E47C